MESKPVKDIKLSNIGRSLQEDIPLIKTEDRLSCNLSKEDFSEHINEEIIRLADDKVTDDMVISIDPGDIMKPYAKLWSIFVAYGMAAKVVGLTGDDQGRGGLIVF